VSILCSLTDTKVKVLCVVMYSNVVSWCCFVPPEMKGTITHLYALDFVFVFVLRGLCYCASPVKRSRGLCLGGLCKLGKCR
jgi:hypothetical protein